MTGGFEEATDFVGRIDVRHAARLAAPKVIRRRQLVPIIFDADVTGEPADRFKPLVALRHGWPLSGPVDRGLRADVGFVPPRLAKWAKLSNRYSAFAISKPAVRRRAR